MAKKTAVAPVYPLPIMMIAFSDDFVVGWIVDDLYTVVESNCWYIGCGEKTPKTEF
jgi:hypothetical protein